MVGDDGIAAAIWRSHLVIPVYEQTEQQEYKPVKNNSSSSC